VASIRRAARPTAIAFPSVVRALRSTRCRRVAPDQVAAMRHESGLEINFIVNAAADASNVLMDVPEKHPGFTHIALQIEDVAAVEAALTAAGIEITGRRGANPVAAIFVRDPDRNVVELAAD